MPHQFLAPARYVFAGLRRRWNKHAGFKTEIAQEFLILLLDLAETFLGEIREIHFIHHHHELPDPEHTQQIGVPPALFPNALICGDHQYRSISP